ncbi:MAG: hypothetical protein EP335_08445 [Alphaproteobacteria bacterium]|nr:MAG: hypothetical protein EP335_08445 [Alphaproteobacteria bacterium]
MEKVLREIQEDYRSKNIWPSTTALVDILLSRGVEMIEVHDELSRKLTSYQAYSFWDAILVAATFWNPENSKELLDEQRQLLKLNQDIVTASRKLSELLKKRQELQEKGRFQAHDDLHVVDWIDRAAAANGKYMTFVQQPIQILASRYEQRYWPEMYEVIEAIGAFASEAEVEPTDEWTEELISSRKCSVADYVRVLLIAITERKEHQAPGYDLPQKFRLTDRAMATLINCTLNLAPDDLLSTEYVKRLRHLVRKKNTS